jgi:hypothetical protein
MIFFLTSAGVASVLALSLVGCASTLPPPKESFRERHEKALAMFAERCKNAGEFIHRTEDNVKGVYILKQRRTGMNYGDQFALDDPYGRDFVGEGYYIGLLRGNYQANTVSGPRSPPPPLGYEFVDVTDAADGARYRYTGSIHTEERTSTANGQRFTVRQFITQKVVAPEPPPRYGITYDDISTHEEREYWIAGSSLKIVDRTTNEVVAERIGYMVDVSQGSQAGGRSPWLFAADHACLAFANPQASSGQGTVGQRRQTQRFVERVLRPTVPEPQGGNLP